jgi:hypothetical protein
VQPFTMMRNIRMSVNQTQLCRLSCTLRFAIAVTKHGRSDACVCARVVVSASLGMLIETGNGLVNGCMNWCQSIHSKWHCFITSIELCTWHFV